MPKKRSAPKKTTAVRLDACLKTWLESRAETECRTLSNTINMLLMQTMREAKKGQKK